MNEYQFSLAGSTLVARASGAVYWPERSVLVVSDLHLGKSERIARRTSTLLPPYETYDTLKRLDTEIATLSPKVVVCLGDSFDDLSAVQGMSDEELAWITRMMAGRQWIWIEGNHDPGPVALGGSHLSELPLAPLTFRHIAKPGASGEISGHYHPKANLSARGRSITRPCILYDSDRAVLPAFGTYTGGLRCTAPELQTLMRPEAVAVLVGKSVQAVPMPGKERTHVS